MPAEPIVATELEAIILKKEPTAERHNKLFILTTQGNRTILLERISKSSSKVQSDLFDDVRLETSTPKSTGFAFIQNYTLLHRRAKIAQNYNCFKDAAYFSNLICCNTSHVTENSKLYDLCVKALSAWESHLPSRHILLKSIYLFIQQEGYPIKEDWLVRLADEQASLAQHILNTPLKSITNRFPEDLLINLLQWTQYHTDLKLPLYVV